ncbi:unnamed protein product [Anisakis simplex]|uniref:Secreted protein n=1 Tax=Anisakis simplex TaxID=6269 RepID=A0A0M3JHK5_ANISI|nr:unnamed protein product [Anisakis simplex]
MVWKGEVIKPIDSIELLLFIWVIAQLVCCPSKVNYHARIYFKVEVSDVKTSAGNAATCQVDIVKQE